ncbi:MAG: hypothetical protein WB996_05500, partial [Ignavibacteriaceae bacterium]
PSVKKTPENSLEKKAYDIIENLKEFLPIANDRNRLGFNLYRYLKGEGDEPEILVLNAKIKIEGISEKELAKKLKTELDKVK